MGVIVDGHGLYVPILMIDKTQLIPSNINIAILCETPYNDQMGQYQIVLDTICNSLNISIYDEETAMSTVNVQLPESLHNTLKELSEKEGVSIDQFITLAVSEKMTALLTVDYLKKQAERGSREAFDKIMSEVPDVEPEEYDRL